MVQISTIFLAAVAAFTPLAAAAICQDQMSYCGSRLMALDNEYANDILQQLQIRGLPTTTTYKQDSIYICNSDGSIYFDAWCGEDQCYVNTTWGDECPN